MVNLKYYKCLQEPACPVSFKSHSAHCSFKVSILEIHKAATIQTTQVDEVDQNPGAKFSRTEEIPTQVTWFPVRVCVASKLWAGVCGSASRI